MSMSSNGGVRRGFVLSVAMLLAVATMASSGWGDDPQPLSPPASTTPEAPAAPAKVDTPPGTKTQHPLIISSGLEKPAELHIEAVLQAKTTIDFAETPLSEAMEYLASVHKFTVMLENDALEEIPVSPDAPITISVADISLGSTLNLMLKRLQLTYIIEDEVLKITSIERASQHLEIRIYDISHLKSAGYTPELMSEVITTAINEAGWKKEQGEGGSVFVIPDGLIVSQTQEVHRKIDKLIKQIERHLESKRGTPAAGNG